MKVEVTLEDIMNGKRCQPQRCPVALAIKRATGQPFVMVATMGFYLGVTPNDSLYEFHNRHVTEWIVALDNSKPVEPFSFEVAIPD